MEDVEPLDIPHADGYVGSKTSGRDLYHTFIAQTDDTDYTFSRNKLDMEQSEVELVQSIGESLKTEEEGSYSPFYERFSLDEHTFHFPMFHNDFVNHVEVSITVIGDDELSGTNDVFVRYNVGEGELEFTYWIKNINLFAGDDDYTEKEFETENGHTVTAYERDYSDYVTYVWEHDDLVYAIILDPTEDLFTDEELHAIIDSSIDDSREFTSDELFKPINAEPTLSDRDQEVLTQLEELADDIHREELVSRCEKNKFHTNRPPLFNSMWKIQRLRVH